MNRLTALTCALLLVPASAAVAEDDADHRPEFSELEVMASGQVRVDGVTYDSMAAYHQSPAFRDSGRRCGAEEPPEVLPIAPSDCDLGTTTIDPAYDPKASEVVQIPVVFHVMESTDGRGAIPDELIQSQIDILNEDFGAAVGTPGALGTDVKIQFALAGVTPDGERTTGINRITSDTFFNDQGGMKSELAWDTERYLNLYSNRAGGALGYASFPQHAGTARDGVVLLWTAIGRDAPNGGVYNQGRTATHEIGHYFGLYHTFQGGCGDPNSPYTSGDIIADTVPEARPQYECVPNESSCGGGMNPIENFMDYTNDECMTGFTAEQANRMRCSLVHYRARLVNTAPVADFTLSPDKLAVQFTDTSDDADGTLLFWDWDFGDGQTSTEQHPTHDYADWGRYNVTLTVTDNRGGRSSVTIPAVANLAPLAHFDYSAEGLEASFQDESSDENGTVISWQWDFGDGATSTEQHPVHTYAEEGTYTVTLTVVDDLGTASTTSEEVTISGGCGCTAGPGGSPLGNGMVFLLGLALSACIARRRRR